MTHDPSGRGPSLRLVGKEDSSSTYGRAPVNRDVDWSILMARALLTVHSIRQTYDPTRPFAPWLVAIANRRFIDRLRRQGRRRDREIPLTAEHETFCEPQANLEESPDRRELEGAINDLPPAQQQAVRLLKLKEMSLKEAATVSGMTIASLKVNVHRALKNLRKMLVDRSEP